VLGMLVGYFEKWPLGAGVYFTFITGLTIGYGDPSHLATRVMAIVIGFIGILLTGLVAAVDVRALQVTRAPQD
jgi:hypothetical protein